MNSHRSNGALTSDRVSLSSSRKESSPYGPYFSAWFHSFAEVRKLNTGGLRKGHSNFPQWSFQHLLPHQLKLSHWRHVRYHTTNRTSEPPHSKPHLNPTHTRATRHPQIDAGGTQLRSTRVQSIPAKRATCKGKGETFQTSTGCILCGVCTSRESA